MLNEKSKRYEVTARLEESLYEQLRERSFKQRKSRQQIFVEALREKLSGVAVELPSRDVLQETTDSEKSWIERLLFVLRSGNADAIEAVTKNIKVFTEYARIKKLESAGSGARAAGDLSKTGQHAANGGADEQASHTVHPRDRRPRKRVNG